VSVREAICFVPRISSLRREYRRKVRTITRGIETLYFKRALLNPLRHGAFSWILVSHKVCRWMIPYMALLALVALCATRSVYGWWAVAAVLAGVLCAALAWWWPDGRRVPKVIAVPAYLVIGNLAALHASLRVLGREFEPIWEPTRRETVPVALSPTASGDAPGVHV
jgi:hypothetical protein